MGRWTNWAGNQSSAPVEHRSVASAAEAADLVRRAAAQGRRVRPLGSGHSFTGIGRPDDIAVRLDPASSTPRLDPRSRLVTVPGGMTLAALNRQLAQRSLALTNLGDIDRQTVAGALATGTHGTGAAFGGLATQVRALEIVLGTGDVVRCSADLHPELFSAARVGLGALGIVTAVTLQAEPLFALRAQESVQPLHEVLADLDGTLDGADHAEFYWFPHTAQALVKRNTRVPIAELAPLRPGRRWMDDELLANGVFGAIIATGRHCPPLIPPLSRLAARALGSRTYTDLSHRVFTSPRRVRFVEMEYAVPRESLADVLKELMDTIDRSGLRVSFPIEVRVAAADDIALSTAYGRRSGYVAVHMEHGTDFRPYFAMIEPILVAAQGRPHWGKMHTLGAQELRRLYPAFSSFAAVRADSDPHGVFGNDYLDRVLGPVGAGVSG